MKLPVPFKILNIVGALLFGFFAWVQANDIGEDYHRPSRLDAALWLCFYGLIAVLCALALFKPLPKWILKVAALTCLIQLGRTGWGLWINLFGDERFTLIQSRMSAADPRVELTREFLGALIALGALGMLWWEQRKFAGSAPSS
ncbi:MAG: transmembrane 220 family protein [Roseibacillus sp.]|jgi:uncharacterized membrane protein